MAAEEYKKKFTESIMEVIEKSDLVDTLKELAEIGIDAFLEDGVLKDIPGLNIVHSIFKVNSTLREVTFVRKIASFFAEVGYVDEKFKNKFMSKYRSDPEYRKNVGEYIINALDRFDQIVKAEALGKIFAAYLKDEIKYTDFTRYSYALDKIDFHNISLLQQFYSSNIDKEHIHLLQNFAFAGLVSIDFGDPLNSRTFFSEFAQGIGFTKNEFGVKFLRVLELL